MATKYDARNCQAEIETDEVLIDVMVDFECNDDLEVQDIFDVRVYDRKSRTVGDHVDMTDEFYRALKNHLESHCADEMGEVIDSYEPEPACLVGFHYA